MRLFLKLLCLGLAMATLVWLVPQIVASFNRATAAGSTDDATRACVLFSGYLLASAALAVFLAREVAVFSGGLVARLFVGGGRIGRFTPAFWRAERLRRQAAPLDAVRVLREQLIAHPRQWRLAVRIAEIYQQDLGNPLAAALEYEAVLQQRLPQPVQAELMVRLAACYLLLRRPDESTALLRRVVEAFPRTTAAGTAERQLARMNKP
jgi:hypothetical protein